MVRNITNAGQVQLTVFKQLNKKDERGYQRYTVDFPAVVRRITAENQENPKTPEA